jgi:hypothetical protein
MGERRGNWMAIVQEFDLDIKPAKIIKGQRLCRMAAEAQDLENVEDSSWENELSLWCIEDLYVPPDKESLYGNLSYLLHHGTCPENLNPRERRVIRLKSTQYHLINSMLFHVNYDGVLLICLEHDDVEKVPKELHDDPIGGNFVGETMTHKILRVGYYWPTLFRDAHAYARKCKYFQVSSEREKRLAIPLHPVTISRPFEQWGIRFLGEITPNSSRQHKYILTATYYFTRWVEAIPLMNVNEKVVIQFLEQQLIKRFGFPSILIFYNDAYFSSALLKEVTLDKGIIMRCYENYYPEENGVVDSTNKNLVRILKNIVIEN